MALMFISKDQKKVFLGVPKTGTRTIDDILKPIAFKINEHKNYPDTIQRAYTIVPNFQESNIETVYLFYRDPVERFISSINHLRDRKFLQFAIRYRPQWFPGVDLSSYNAPVPMEQVPPFPQHLFLRITSDVSEACKSKLGSITPEQIFNDSELMSKSTFLVKQSFWHQNIPSDKKIILNFANFETSARTVATAFGSPSDITINRLNEGNRMTTSLSPELEAAVKAHYSEDYDLQP